MGVIIKIVNFFAFLALIVGALNWGCVGFAEFNFLEWLLGGKMSVWPRVLFSFVGLMGIWSLGFFRHLGTLVSGKHCDHHHCNHHHHDDEVPPPPPPSMDNNS